MRREDHLFQRMETFEEDKEFFFGFLGAFVSHSPEQRGERRVCAGVFRDVPGEVHTTEKDVDIIAVDHLDPPTLGMVSITHKRLNARVVFVKECEEVAE